MSAADCVPSTVPSSSLVCRSLLDEHIARLDDPLTIGPQVVHQNHDPDDHPHGDDRRRFVDRGHERRDTQTGEVDSKGGKHDWRAEITAALAKLQKPDGSWVNDQHWMESDPNLITGYALMALSYCKPKPGK